VQKQGLKLEGDVDKMLGSIIELKKKDPRHRLTGLHPLP
jgi:hypothetical protein